MCGICGIIMKDPASPVPDGLLARMNALQRHRGPDDSGVHVDGHVGLGHVRLSILDLSPLGHQPMSNEDGGVWVTFNGEIYNYEALREQLVQKGHVFASRTDTEVLAHLWEEKGEHCVDELEGMFAFAIWDTRHHTLFMARDRMGKKPLFYAELPDRLLFASEPKCFLADPAFEARPDLAGIHLYLTYQSVPAPHSAFQNVRKLPAACCALLRDDGLLRVRRYWRLSYQDQFQIETPAQERELEERLHHMLRQSVRKRLRSDVPLGAFLSGGVDSSMVVALMASMSDRPVKTFSIGFAEEEYNELPYARMVARHCATEHHELVVRPDAAAVFPELVWHYGEPFADSSAIPTYYLSKLTREGVVVALSGDGGDENFAGYPRYVMSDADRALRPWASQPLWTDPRLAEGMPPEFFPYYLRMTHFHEAYQETLYGEALSDQARRAPGVGLLLDLWRKVDAPDTLGKMTGVDFGLYLPDTLMTKVDIAAMAHSLEVRCPFLDHKLIEFAARIPSRLKLHGGTEGKHIFKRIAERYLPRQVIYRRKMGFGVPLDHWFRNELKEMAHDVLLSQRAMQRGYFRREHIERILALQEQPNGQSWHYHIWNLLMLELWHLMFIDRVLEPPASALPAWRGSAEA